MKPCIFCRNPRTTKRGEHVWDNWLNKSRKNYHYSVTEFGADNVVLREYRSRLLSATKNVVCDICNHGWMSSITTESKHTIDAFAGHGRPASLLAHGLATMTTYAVMKAMVLDWSAEGQRTPLFSKANCHLFRRSLTTATSEMVAIPDGVQLWVGAYNRARQVEAQYWINGLVLKSGRYSGFHVLFITYVIDALVWQLTFPRWKRISPCRVELPTFQQGHHWDTFSIPIWPFDGPVTWPPLRYMDSGTLDRFHQRFGVEPMLTAL